MVELSEQVACWVLEAPGWGWNVGTGSPQPKGVYRTKGIAEAV